MKHIITALIATILLLTACGGEKPVSGICYVDLYEYYHYRAWPIGTDPYTWDESSQKWITEFGIKGYIAGPDTVGSGFHMETKDRRETDMLLNAFPFDTLSHTNVKYVYDARVAPRKGKLPVIQQTGETVIRHYSACIFIGPR